MRQIDVGKSGLMGSEIVLGCMRINSLTESELDTHIKTALEQGINHFDHADIYADGECETAFGKVLQNDKSLRDKMIVQSKCGISKHEADFTFYNFSKEYIIKSVDSILKRLAIDELDVLLLHRPDALMEPDEVAEAFTELEKSGKVKQFGVSNFNPMQVKLLKSAVKQKLIANQMQFSIMHTGMIDFGICTNTTFEGSVNHDGGILDYCHLHDITMQAWSPFQYGFFEGVFVDNDKFPKLNAKLEELSKKYGVSKSALAVAWISRHPAKIQTIVGTTNTERLKDICTASKIKLERKDWYDIYLAADNILP